MTGCETVRIGRLGPAFSYAQSLIALRWIHLICHRTNAADETVGDVSTRGSNQGKEDMPSDECFSIVLQIAKPLPLVGRSILPVFVLSLKTEKFEAAQKGTFHRK